MERQVHNTNSPNFVKLDYQDITNLLTIVEDYVAEMAELTQDEEVTLARLKIIEKFMKEKYSKRKKRNE